MFFRTLLASTLMISVPTFGAIDEAYDGDVTLVLRGYDGHTIEYPEEKKGLRESIYIRDEERVSYDEKTEIKDLSQLPEAEAIRRILMFVGNETAYWRIDRGVSYGYRNGVVPIVEVRDSTLAPFLKIFEGTGIEWEVLPDQYPRRRIIRDDIAPILHRQTQNLQAGISRSLREVVGLTDISRPEVADLSPLDKLLSLDLNPIFQVLEAYDAEEWKGAPVRLLSRKGFVNLAKLTAAENAWTEQVSSLQYSLRELLRRLEALKTADLMESMAQGRSDFELIEQGLIAHHDKKDGKHQDEKLVRMPPSHLASRKASYLAQAASSLLIGFQFIRHSQRQWTHVDPTQIMALYSFGALATLDLLERHPGFISSVYANRHLEDRLLSVIRPYLSEGASLDRYSVELMMKIYGQRSLHPLVRLSAYSLLGPHRPPLSLGEFEILYKGATERVVLSPTYSQVRPTPHIDYPYTSKTSVKFLVDAVNLLGKERGLEPLSFPSRRTIDHESHPKSSDHPSEQLVRRILKKPTRKPEPAPSPPTGDKKPHLTLVTKGCNDKFSKI